MEDVCICCSLRVIRRCHRCMNNLFISVRLRIIIKGNTMHGESQQPPKKPKLADTRAPRYARTTVI